MKEFNLYVKIGTLSRYSGIHPDTLHALVQKGELPLPIKIDGIWFFLKKEVQKWAREQGICLKNNVLKGG
jgi:predicted DNA-binding transcriptional regulator AlpA